MTIGIRDTRKIDAVYNLTEIDVREQGRFQDSIGIYPEFIDGYGVLVLPTTGRYLQIPYRSLLPQAVRHLIVAGRATGGDRIAHAATRNMSCCAVTGQGAGVAAAVSIRTGRPLEEVDVCVVQAELTGKKSVSSESVKAGNGPDDVWRGACCPSTSALPGPRSLAARAGSR